MQAIQFPVGLKDMKVVLLKDVKNMGKAGTVHDVAHGHALNLLIPRGQAIQATPAAIKKAEGAAAQQQAHHAVSEALITERMAVLAEEKTVITKKANEQGHLYDAVDAKDIADAAQLPVETIRLEKPLKETGTFTIPVSHGKDFGSIAITIEAE